MMHRQRGQSLTEFVVVALALIPLFLLMPLVAKYQDIAHATLMASRYAAFDAMVNNDAMSEWKPTDKLAGEVQRRFFSNPEAPIKDGDTPGDFRAHQNPFWRGPQDKALIEQFNRDVRISFGTGYSSSHTAAYSSGSDDLPFVGTSSALKLKSPGIYRANVSVSVANLLAPEESITHTYDGFDKLNLKITRHTSLLVDSWTGGREKTDVQRHLDNPIVFPGSLLSSVAPVVDLGVTLVEMPSCLNGGCTPGPKLGELEFWQGVTPRDRQR